MNLIELVKESWRIEGIFLYTSDAGIIARYQEDWLQREVMTVAALSEAAYQFTNGYGRLRVAPGMDVQVGRHIAPRGGPGIEADLRDICESREHPYIVHQRFEQLHPFMDGNGRTGRLLWLWSMKQRDWPVERGFLHEWYYQSLETRHS